MSELERLTIPRTIFQEDINEEVGLEVQDKLAKANITEPVLAAMREEAALFDKPVSSEQDFKLLQGMLGKLVNTRNNAVRICEHGRRPAIMVQRAYIAMEKYVTGEIKRIEAPLEARRKAWADEQERLRREAEEREAAAIRARLKAIEDLGFRFRAGIGEPDRYVLGSTAITVDEITGSEKEVYEALLRSAGIVAAEERERQEEEERARREQQQAMAAKEAELARREQALREMTVAARVKLLVEAGCELKDGLLRIMRDGTPLFELETSALADMSDELFAKSQAAAVKCRAEADAPPPDPGIAAGMAWDSWADRVRTTAPTDLPHPYDSAVADVLLYVGRRSIDLAKELQLHADGFRRVVHTAEFAEDGDEPCPQCGEYMDACLCPGPTMETDEGEPYDYIEHGGALYARPPKKEQPTPTRQ